MLKQRKQTPFIKWLLDNKKYIKYFVIETEDYQNDGVWNLSIDNCISKINEFYEKRLIYMFPDQPQFKEITPYSLISHFPIHKHYIIQYFIFKLKAINFRNALLECKELISRLESSKMESNNEFLICDYEGLFREMFHDTDEVQKLMFADYNLVNFISNDNLILIKNNFEGQKEMFYKLLYSFRLFYNSNDMEIPFTLNQEKFEQFIFHPNFLFYHDIMDLLGKKNEEFGKGCFNLLNNMVKKFLLDDEKDYQIFSFVFFRAMFDEYYWINSRIECSNNILYLKDILDDLIDKNLLFNFSNDIPLIDFVKQLTKITNDITYLVYYNSPLDILFYHIKNKENYY